MYYTGVHDPALEADVVRIERLYTRFAKRYADLAFLEDSEALAKSLQAYTKLMEQRLDTPLRYLYFRLDQNARDTAAEQKRNLLESRLVRASNQVIFYSLAIARLPKRTQTEYGRADCLKTYRYFLKDLWQQSRYLLSEPEEKILQEKAMPAHSLWVDGTEKILATRSITYKKQELPLLSAIEQINAVPSKEKPKLWRHVTEALASCEEVVENELNAVCIDKKIDDELRGYTSPEQATVLGYDNDPKTVSTMVDVVTRHGYPLSRSFYALKADYHGVETLPYVNRYDDITPMPTFTFPQTVDILREVFYDLRTEYGELFDRLLAHGHIDVYPKSGKQGGAFMASGINEPIMLKLNHVDTFGSLKTVAHEMGHAIHAHRTQQSQPAHYQDYSITTAETASTLFEHFVFSHVYARIDDPTQRQGLLHNKIANDIAGIQRQIGFYNFERQLHQQVREHGAVSKETMRQLLQKELRAHLGARVEVSEDDARSYVYVGHFRKFFYVYTYAYGHLLSSLMHQKYQADHNYLDCIDDFLRAGSSDSVERIFTRAAIDTYDTATFREGLQSLRKDITTLRKGLKREGV